MPSTTTTVWPRGSGAWFCAAIVLFQGAMAWPVRAEGRAGDPVAPAGAEVAPALRTYRAKAGESLDHVIRQTMPESPLKIELLRKAFVDLNGKAFTGGNAAKLRANVTLQVPDTQRLTRSVLAAQAEGHPASHAAEEPPYRSGPTSGVTQEGRRWVRYP